MIPMLPLPDELLVPMVGVVVALLLFGALLQWGVWIIRRLKLPNDLPEGPHFEPPPPAIRDAIGPDEARRIAAVQLQRRARFARARAAATAAMRCAEWASQDYPTAAGMTDPRPELQRLADQAKAAAESAERLVRSTDDEAQAGAIDHHATTAETAASQAEAIVAKHPSGRERRLRIMLIILAVMIVWCALMFLVMPGRR